ncbi:MAG: hypothetical protein IT254_07740 [Chitinophagaceae bacterium]|nr:hypothetical protein [Bacteroidota bacterium]MCC6258196.1 hypothetical protein [Chitinophagaceae bacterium]MCW5916145.1 hypothetical protein [Ferruginibacter sp.]
MKIYATLISFLLLVCHQTGFSQKTGKEIKVGHIFQVSIPDYMNKTVGLNNVASIQFISPENDVAGFVIEDSKEDLKLADTSFASLKDFYSFFEKDFLSGLSKRTISPIHEFQKNGKNYLEFDASYFDEDLKSEVSYYVCLIEENDYYYKLICWSAGVNKEKFKPDFQKIALSIHE